MLGASALMLDLTFYGIVLGTVLGFIGVGVALLCPRGTVRAIAVAVNFAAIVLAVVVWVANGSP